MNGGQKRGKKTETAIDSRQFYRRLVQLAALGAFVFHWHVLAVYACTCLDEVGKIPWVMIRFRKYKWVRNLTREQNEPGPGIVKES